MRAGKQREVQEDAQQCQHCGRLWPFVAFRSNDMHSNHVLKPEICVRCQSPALEDWRWRQLTREMRNRINLARQQLRDQTAILLQQHAYQPAQPPPHAVSPHLPSNLSASYGPTTHDAFTHGQAPQSSSTFPDERRVSLGIKSAKRKPERQAGAAYRLAPFSEHLKIAEHPHHAQPLPKEFGLLPEPTRASLWLKMFFKATDQDTRISQMTVNLFYRASFPTTVFPEAFESSPVLAGAELIRLITKVFLNAALQKEGYLVKGLEKRKQVDPHAYDTAWALVARVQRGEAIMPTIHTDGDRVITDPANTVQPTGGTRPVSASRQGSYSVVDAPTPVYFGMTADLPAASTSHQDTTLQSQNWHAPDQTSYGTQAFGISPGIFPSTGENDEWSRQQTSRSNPPPIPPQVHLPSREPIELVDDSENRHTIEQPAKPPVPAPAQLPTTTKPAPKRVINLSAPRNQPPSSLPEDGSSMSVDNSQSSAQRPIPYEVVDALLKKRRLDDNDIDIVDIGIVDEDDEMIDQLATDSEDGIHATL